MHRGAGGRGVCLPILSLVPCCRRVEGVSKRRRAEIGKVKGQVEAKDGDTRRTTEGAGGRKGRNAQVRQKEKEDRDK